MLPIATAALLAACASPAASVAGPASEPPASAASAASVPTGSAEPAAIAGTWHRPQTCEEMLAAFTAAGLATSHAGWLQGNFFGETSPPPASRPCEGALGPLEHDHFFTADGTFGSHDQAGQPVDDGDYVAVDENTVSFPSHAREFGYAGDLVVDYVVDGDTVTFDVMLPASCDDACRDAYAWALSAFASGPWEKGSVP